MAASIPFHQGDLGVWNWLLNLILVTLVLALIVTGSLLWWKRRPRLATSIANPGANKALAGLLLVVSLCFPLSALTLAALIALDTAIRLLHSAVRSHA